MLRRRVQRVRGVHLRVITAAGNAAIFEEMLHRQPAVGNAVTNFTVTRFKPQTIRSRNEGVTARPTAFRTFDKVYDENVASDIGL